MKGIPAGMLLVRSTGEPAADVLDRTCPLGMSYKLDLDECETEVLLLPALESNALVQVIGGGISPPEEALTPALEFLIFCSLEVTIFILLSLVVTTVSIISLSAIFSCNNDYMEADANRFYNPNTNRLVCYRTPQEKEVPIGISGF